MLGVWSSFNQNVTAQTELTMTTKRRIAKQQ